jgi:cytoskeletal protein CcmA (bactofilin family)
MTAKVKIVGALRGEKYIEIDGKRLEGVIAVEFAMDGRTIDLRIKLFGDVEIEADVEQIAVQRVRLPG